MGHWTEINLSDDKWEIVWKQARGSYQRDLLKGNENLSGSTLRGKAKSYGGHYARSRNSLLARLDAAGITWSEKRGKNGRRILVLGDDNNG